MKVKPLSKVVLNPENFKANVSSRTFDYPLDTAIEKGGSNTGPTPVEYFLAAIGGCVAITLKTFADKQNWDLGSISVEVSEETKLTPKGIQKRIIENISVEKEVSETQLVQLKEHAKNCPVAQMVTGETTINRIIKHT